MEPSITTIPKFNDIPKPFCPEESYCDQHWENVIAECKNLANHPVSWTTYYVKYSLPLAFNDFMNKFTWDWWNEIGKFEKGKLFLGALPIKRLTGRNDLEKLLDYENIHAVLSVTEVFENRAKGLMTSAITPDEWESQGIKQLQILSADFETISIENINRGIEYIHWNLKNSRNIYVHCKAGRGRSALIEMCYLVKYHNMTAEEAFKTIKNARPQAGFSKNNPKWTTLKQYEKFYKKTKV